MRDLCFDSSGTYLAVAGSDVRVYLCKQWNELKVPIWYDMIWLPKRIVAYNFFQATQMFQINPFSGSERAHGSRHRSEIRRELPVLGLRQLWQDPQGLWQLLSCNSWNFFGNSSKHKNILPPCDCELSEQCTSPSSRPSLFEQVTTIQLQNMF